MMNPLLKPNRLWWPLCGSGWLVAGVGDFNADGLTDILFQNPTTREVGTWLMDDTTQVGWISITIAPLNVRIYNH